MNSSTRLFDNSFPEPRRKKFVVGYVAPYIVEDDSIFHIKGILEEAGKENACIKWFIGDQLIHSKDIDDHPDAFYELAAQCKLDGMIIWSSKYRQFFSFEEVEEFLRIFRHFKVVNIGTPIGGFPSVIRDGTCGIADLFEHLMKYHGYQRVAYIRGPVYQQDSQKRYEEYIIQLQKYNLPFDQRLVTECPDFSNIRGGEAVREYLDVRKLKPGIDIDVIVCSSDGHSIEVIAELERRGIRVPDDIAVVALNDKNRVIRPPLTSLGIPLLKFGAHACRMLLEMIKKGTNEHEDITLSPQLFIRESCGCSGGNSVVMTNANQYEIEKNKEFLETFQKKIQKLNYINHKSEDSLPHMEGKMYDILNELRYADEHFAKALDLCTLMEKFERIVHRLKISSCYVSVYKDFKNPMEAFSLIFAYRNSGGIKLDKPIDYPPDKLLPDCFRSDTEEENQIIVPLSVKDRNIGFVVFDMVVEDLIVYTLLCRRLSAEMHRIITSLEIKETENILVESEAKYRGLFEAMGDPVLLVDQGTGSIMDVNQSACSLYGYTSEEMKKLRKTDLSAEPEETMKATREFNTSIQLRYHKKKDGSIFPVDIRGSMIDIDGLSTILVSIRDITERVRAEEELKYQKEFFETVFENIPEPFVIYGTEGDLVKMNMAARKLYLQPDTEDKVMNYYNPFRYFDFDGNEIPSKDIPVNRALRGEKVENEIIVIKRAEKDQITEVNAVPIFDKDNNLIYCASFHRDITEKIQAQRLIKKQQEQMLQTEKEKIQALKQAIEMKDEFLSLVSHEFKTPLTVINSAIQAMKHICRNELSDKALGFLNNILQSSNRQLKLVNNLLDITRINAGHLKINKTNLDIVLLTRSITESISIFAQQKNIKLSFSSTIGKKIIGIDEEKYERILLNLLSNAVKFTPKGKSVFVKVYQKIVEGKCRVFIQVKDTGIGIPPEKQQLIFERFGQVDSSLSRQAEGTGIGLSLVKLFAEMLGGEILLVSKEGKGSTFTIMLPVEKVKETPLEKRIQEISDSRLIKSTIIEFSDVYY